MLGADEYIFLCMHVHTFNNYFIRVITAIIEMKVNECNACIVDKYYKHTNTNIAQSVRAVEYIDCFSAEGWDPTPPTSVLVMTLNNLMVTFR